MIASGTKRLRFFFEFFGDKERRREKEACCVVARGTRRAWSPALHGGPLLHARVLPEMANAANASGSVGSNSEEATIAKLLKYGRLEGDPFTALDFLDDAVKRAERMVAASEDGGDGDGGRAFGVLASCLVARGNALLGAQDWDAADADLTRAASMSRRSRALDLRQQGQVFSYYEASATAPSATRGRWAIPRLQHRPSLSQGAEFEGRYGLRACSGVLASSSSIGLDVEEVPEVVRGSLRGGPPTMLQRAGLSVALAKSCR